MENADKYTYLGKDHFETMLVYSILVMGILWDVLNLEQTSGQLIWSSEITNNGKTGYTILDFQTSRYEG